MEQQDKNYEKHQEKNNEKQKDKKVLKQFGKYASLNVLGMLGLSCYIMADTYFVAQGMGVTGLTALNLAIPIYSFIHGSGLMLGMGGATRFSILKGQKDNINTDQVFTRSAIFALLLSCIFFITGLFFANPLSTLLGADDTTFTMTSVYLRVILLFAPMFMLNNVVNCFVRNDGNPKLSMIAMITGSLSNVVLDYIFIFPFNWGMFGAAFATGLAPVISLCILSLHFIKKKNTVSFTKVKLSLKSFMDISALGSSSLIMEVSSGVVMLVFNFIILNLEGNIGIAAYGVIANLALVVMGIFTGIAQGIQPIISKNHGLGKTRNIKKTFRYAIITAVSFGLAVYGVILLYSKEIIAIFNNEQNQELINIANLGLKIYFAALVLVGINMVSAVYFSSVDKPAFSFWISILRGFIVIMPMAFILSSILSMTGVWLAFPATEVVTFFATLFLFMLYKKQRKSIETIA